MAPVTQLGGYTIRSELGRGGMATVYLAEELLSRRLVALKVLHRDLTSSEDARRMGCVIACRPEGSVRSR